MGGRLVGQHQGWVLDQRPGDGHPLLLAAGHLVGSVVAPLAQPHLVQEGVGPLPGGTALVPAKRRGTITLARALRLGIRLKAWNTTPTVWRR